MLFTSHNRKNLTHINLNKKTELILPISTSTNYLMKVIKIVVKG